MTVRPVVAEGQPDPGFDRCASPWEYLPQEPLEFLAGVGPGLRSRPRRRRRSAGRRERSRGAAARAMKRSASQSSRNRRTVVDGIPGAGRQAAAANPGPWCPNPRRPPRRPAGRGPAGVSIASQRAISSSTASRSCSGLSLVTPVATMLRLEGSPVGELDRHHLTVRGDVRQRLQESAVRQPAAGQARRVRLRVQRQHRCRDEAQRQPGARTAAESTTERR